MSDRILLQGLQFYGYHGVRPEENTLGQRFVVDVEMRADLRAAGHTDDLTKTVDYGAVHASIRAIVEGPPMKLIEAVAECIAEMILADYPVGSVRLRVSKPDVPIEGTLEYVGVEIERGAEEPTDERRWKMEEESAKSVERRTKREEVKPNGSSNGHGGHAEEAAGAGDNGDEAWHWDDQPARAYLSLGSNLGDRLKNLARAVYALGDVARVTTVSPVYETAALGSNGEGVVQPPFLNCAVAIETELSPRDLLAYCARVEQAQGRVAGPRWQPRSIDIDLLLYGDARIDAPDLAVPHPRLHERAFVLQPLVNLDPALSVAGVGLLADRLPRVAGQGIRLHTSAAGFAVLIENAR